MNPFQTVIAILILSFTTIAGAETWWENETQMGERGRFDLTSKSWWKDAQALKLGEQLSIDSEKAPDGKGKMVVRREKRQRAKDEEMLVWILDDDGDMGAERKGDGDSDCFVVDYGCDGTVDRIVDYIDSDGDQTANEMDIRYFVDGELRRSWMGWDLDGDGEMWDLLDYEYTGNFFASDPYDDNMIYMNKYNPITNKWMPISECPFAFYDTDDNGASDVVARFSAAPLAFSEHDDPDFANSQKRYQGAHYAELENIGLMNIRYSFDIDGQSSPDKPLHYEMGFNMIADVPYQFPKMEHHQPLRRAPKTTICCPYNHVRTVAETYPAEQTGFTWREFEDTKMKIGDPTRPEYDRRWEGVFWTWHRRIMHNTGGPVQDWNVRREYCPTPSEKREVYYSPVDRRIHLKGAVEGWIQIGHIVGDEELGEIRMFDADEDGYFDRWEYLRDEDSAPYRVATAIDAENRDFGNDWKEVQRFYTQEVLPQAIAEDEAVLEAFGDFSENEVVSRMRSRLEKLDVSADETRYILDLLREYTYFQFMERFRAKAKGTLDSLPDQDPRSKPVIMDESTEAWDLIVFLTELDAAYGQGAYEKVAGLLNENKENLLSK